MNLLDDFSQILLTFQDDQFSVMDYEIDLRFINQNIVINNDDRFSTMDREIDLRFILIHTDFKMPSGKTNDSFVNNKNICNVSTYFKL